MYLVICKCIKNVVFICKCMEFANQQTYLRDVQGSQNSDDLRLHGLPRLINHNQIKVTC